MHRAVIALLVFMITIAPAWAQSDPRTAILDERPRLDKPITLDLRAASLREVLEKVQAETGVRLRTEREIGGDKATVYVKDKPARDVLRALAHCFNLGWELDDSGDTEVLRLWMDPSYLEDMRRRRYDDFLAIIRRFDTECQSIADYVRSGQNYEVSGEALRQLKDRDEANRMMLRSIATRQPHRAAAALQFLALTPAQRKDLMDGKDLTVEGGAISSEALSTYPELTSMTLWFERSMAGYLLQGSVRPYHQGSDWTLFTLATFDDSRYDKIIQAANEGLKKDLRLQRELPEIKPERTSDVNEAEGSATQPSAAEVAERKPQIPVPLARPGQGSAATPATMSDELRPIAETCEVPIVAQYLSEYAGVQPAAISSMAINLVGSPKAKACDRLAELCQRHKFTVEADGDFLLARSVLWHRLRQREVPEEQIRRWQKACTGLMYPTFEVALEMGNGTWDQVRGVIGNSPYWFGCEELGMLASCEYSLKLYSTLKTPQREALLRGLPIPVATLKPEQQKLFMQAYEVRPRPTYADAQDPNWVQQATFSVTDASWSQRALFAVSGGRCLDARYMTIEGTLDQPAVTQEQAQAAMAMRVQQAARAFASEVAKAHPGIPRRSIDIYAQGALQFTLRIGEKENPNWLPYSRRIPM